MTPHGYIGAERAAASAANRFAQEDEIAEAFHTIEARKVYQWGLYREIVLKKHPAWQTLTAPPV